MQVIFGEKKSELLTERIIIVKYFFRVGFFTFFKHPKRKILLFLQSLKVIYVQLHLKYLLHMLSCTMTLYDVQVEFYFFNPPKKNSLINFHASIKVIRTK